MVTGAAAWSSAAVRRAGSPLARAPAFECTVVGEEPLEGGLVGRHGRTPLCLATATAKEGWLPVITRTVIPAS
jgi:hypothetical protein